MCTDWFGNVQTGLGMYRLVWEWVNGAMCSDWFGNGAMCTDWFRNVQTGSGMGQWGHV